MPFVLPFFFPSSQHHRPSEHFHRTQHPNTRQQPSHFKVCSLCLLFIFRSLSTWSSSVLVVGCILSLVVSCLALPSASSCPSRAQLPSSSRPLLFALSNWKDDYTLSLFWASSFRLLTSTSHFPLLPPISTFIAVWHELNFTNQRSRQQRLTSALCLLWIPHPYPDYPPLPSSFYFQVAQICQQPFYLSSSD